MLIICTEGKSSCIESVKNFEETNLMSIFLFCFVTISIILSTGMACPFAGIEWQRILICELTYTINTIKKSFQHSKLIQW